ncbi:MAG: polysaccharide biosynthesis C-terminal domain-containing protein [Myxococcota bacterium]
MRESLGGVLLVAAPAAAGLWLVGPQLLGLAFGPEFDDSASVLRILAGVLGLSFVSRLLGSFLMAARQEHVRNRSYRVAAAVSVAGNAVLIPALGIHGAALAAVAVEIVL